MDFNNGSLKPHALLMMNSCLTNLFKVPMASIADGYGRTVLTPSTADLRKSRVIQARDPSSDEKTRLFKTRLISLHTILRSMESKWRRAAVWTSVSACECSSQLAAVIRAWGVEQTKVSMNAARSGKSWWRCSSKG